MGGQEVLRPIGRAICYPRVRHQQNGFYQDLKILFDNNNDKIA